MPCCYEGLVAPNDMVITADQIFGCCGFSEFSFHTRTTFCILQLASRNDLWRSDCLWPLHTSEPPVVSSRYFLFWCPASLHFSYYELLSITSILVPGGVIFLYLLDFTISPYNCFHCPTTCTWCYSTIFFVMTYSLCDAAEDLQTGRFVLWWLV